MKPLSPREAQALEFIRIFSERNGRSPYFKEIAAHFGSPSKGFVSRILSNMARNGVIARIPHVPGSITIGGVANNQITFSLRSEVRASLERIAKAEQVGVETLIAEWVSERVIYELRSKAVAA